MEPITVNYKVLDPRAKVPAYATPGAAAARSAARRSAPWSSCAPPPDTW